MFAAVDTCPDGKSESWGLFEAFDQVIQAARLGAEWAWRAIYRDFASDLLRYAYATRVSDPEDLVGDVFLKVVKSIRRFQGDERAFRTWVFTLARNRAIDERRSHNRRRTDPVADEVLVRIAPSGDAEAEAMRALAEEHVRRVVDLLTPDQRDVLLLRILAGLTVEQVAAVLGKRAGAVKSLQARAIAAIKREISSGAVTL